MYLVLEEELHDIDEPVLGTQMKGAVSAIITRIYVTSAHQKKLHCVGVMLPNSIVQRSQTCFELKIHLNDKNLFFLINSFFTDFCFLINFWKKKMFDQSTGTCTSFTLSYGIIGTSTARQ